VPKQLPVSWKNVAVLSAVHLAAAVGLTLYIVLGSASLASLAVGVVWTVLSIFSISAGYHRLFSHRAYEAHPLFRFFLLAVGAGTFQNSARKWAIDHRRHHAKVDTDLDPYDARRGFWYSHVGWVLYEDDPDLVPEHVPDLDADKLVRWQERHYVPIGIVTGVILPGVVAYLLGDAWGGFILGVPVRMVFVWHATFAINSFAHMLGVQPYSDNNTSRDSFLTALISMGEGYHNFHHTFPADYRNGVRAHQFDPTKWILRTLELVGVTRNLKRASREAIQRARQKMTARRNALGEAAKSAALAAKAAAHSAADAAKSAVDAATSQTETTLAS